MPHDTIPSRHPRIRLLAGVGLVVVTAAIWVIALTMVSGCVSIDRFGPSAGELGQGSQPRG